MKKHLPIFFVLSFVLIAAIIACSIIYSQKLPAKAEQTMTHYYEAFKDGTKESEKYAYFINETKHDFYVNAAEYLLDYKIEAVKKLKSGFYELTVSIKTNYSGESYEQITNFLAKIDGKWYVINGVGNLPEPLLSYLDKEKYSTDQQDWVFIPLP